MFNSFWYVYQAGYISLEIEELPCGDGSHGVSMGPPRSRSVTEDISKMDWSSIWNTFRGQLLDTLNATCQTCHKNKGI